MVQLFGVQTNNNNQSSSPAETHCEQTAFAFQACGSREVIARFDGGTFSTDAGVLLLRETDRSLGLTRKLAACFTDRRRPDRIEHTVEELVAQRVHAIALGYEDLNDHATLRNDPLLQLSAGKFERPDSDNPDNPARTLASPPTLNRLELSSQRHDHYHKVHLDQENAAALLRSTAVRTLDKNRREVIIDFDATDAPLHGNQEGRFFQGYYNNYCYLPLYAFIEDLIVHAQLRTADQDASNGTVEALEKIVPLIRKRCPKALIIVRGDSGYCREPIMRYCEQNGLRYVLGLAGNARLARETAFALSQARGLACVTKKAARMYHEFEYQTLESWSRPRRVICKAERLDGKDNPRQIVTNLDADPRHLYEKVYCARGEMENRIKEQQLDLFADRLSCADFAANQTRLLLSAFAYTLVERLRAIALKGSELAQATAATIRLKLFKLAARVEVSVRRITVRLSQSNPARTHFEHAWRRLRARGPAPG